MRANSGRRKLERVGECSVMPNVRLTLMDGARRSDNVDEFPPPPRFFTVEFVDPSTRIRTQLINFTAANAADAQRLLVAKLRDSSGCSSIDLPAGLLLWEQSAIVVDMRRLEIPRPPASNILPHAGVIPARSSLRA